MITYNVDFVNNTFKMYANVCAKITENAANQTILNWKALCKRVFSFGSGEKWNKFTARLKACTDRRKKRRKSFLQNRLRPQRFRILSQRASHQVKSRVPPPIRKADFRSIFRFCVRCYLFHL